MLPFTPELTIRADGTYTMPTCKHTWYRTELAADLGGATVSVQTAQGNEIYNSADEIGGFVSPGERINYVVTGFTANFTVTTSVSRQ